MNAVVPRFESVAEYAGCFNDAAYWQPYVDQICRRHGLTPAAPIDAGLPGTFPVFIVGRCYVVKLFGVQFDGVRRFELEHTVYGMLQAAPSIAAPALLAAGRLFPGELLWSWPYLVSSALPGRSLGEDRARVSYADQQAVVGWLGRQMRALYELQLPGTGELSRTWQRFVHFLHQRRALCAEQHRRWGSMPRHLLEQIDDYLLPVDALVGRSTTPRLLHCDMNQDHVLGVFQGTNWIPSGVIDFGDAMAGDPMYDLVAFHTGLAHCDKQLLRLFIDATGLRQYQQQNFVHRAMCYTLLFEHDALGQVFAESPAARGLPGLAELAAWLWDLEQPGSAGLSAAR